MTRIRWALAPRTTRLLLALVVVLVLVVAGSLIRPPYLILRPGPAVDTLGEFDGTKIIEVSGAPTHPTQGSLEFTTVAQFGGPGFDINVWDLLLAQFDANAEILPRAQLYPIEPTREEYDQATSAQMAGSQHLAEAVALRTLGYDEEAVIAEVLPGRPAAGLLRSGDVVLAAGGRPVVHTSDVPAAVQATAAGRPVPLRVRRDARTVDVSVPTTQADGRRVIGIRLQPRFPQAPTVTIRAGHVGGPSAGMMFALGLYDVLTPGALTGGKAIAGTGSLSLDGGIIPIGGIRHKMVGARAGGAGYFLAPAANCAEVVGHVPDGLVVTKVSTFADARAAVETIATGDATALPGCG